jgi:hypothetical protein
MRLVTVVNSDIIYSVAALGGVQASMKATPSGVIEKCESPFTEPTWADRYFLVKAAAKNRSSDSTSPGSATVSAISWRKRSRYLFRSL